MQIEHLFYQKGMLNDADVYAMNLARAGIALRCRCGAHMATDMIHVLFDDKGMVKVSGQPIRCSRCGAIYRRGERLRYSLVKLDVGRSGHRFTPAK